MKPASSEARKAAISATSSAVPSRPCLTAMRSANGMPIAASMVGTPRATIAVSMNAGQTALTRMFAGRSSIAATSVMRITAPLVAQ